ncbi:MAG: 16S rRNA (adenine(1518)-N(6)/adenine(1519)-N(6))-dimethyltransferase RsmA [Verrucomicrobiales bacterium]|nr:16S rRNA (adenine(1518)-N(6)/adenine(1519)-N(6))-dimethyltransferase RsmA [Verrucomicrobiales bacterium]
MSNSDIRQTLAKLDVTPSRKLGQNFLSDAGTARRIVDLLDIGPEDTVVEIGPGLGALTDHIVGHPKKLVLVEKDRRLAAALADAHKADPSIEVHHGDATELDTRGFFPAQPVKCIGNLPYSSGTAITTRLAQNPSPMSLGVFMLQKEVAQRMAATPGTKAYGTLSLAVQSRWTVTPSHPVPPQAFYPAPQVDSAVITLTPRPRDEFPAFDERLFARLVKIGFAQRRKQLKKLLPEFAGLAATLDLPLTSRAEELTLSKWIDLTNLLDSNRGPEHGQSADEIFDVVDGNDQPVSTATRGEVHRDGLRHRAVHIFVFNKNGELFLQKRSHLKDAHPGKWDSSASGHLDAGEDYQPCAQRELNEELGIGAGLTEIARVPACDATGQEFVRVYRADIKNAKGITYPCTEIETGTFFPLETVRQWIQNHPADLATGFTACFQAWDSNH